jgi:hypothetical protein
MMPYRYPAIAMPASSRGVLISGLEGVRSFDPEQLVRVVKKVLAK